MEEAIVNRETYEKMVNCIAQLPYGQVAQLLAEVGQNTRFEKMTELKVEDGD